MKSLEAGPQVEARLLAAFQNRANVVSLGSVGRNRHRRYWIAAAAALLIVFTVALLRSRQPRLVMQPLREVAQQPVTPAAPAGNKAPLSSPRNEAIRDLPISKSQRLYQSLRSQDRYVANYRAKPGSQQGSGTSTIAAAASDEVATDFFPINDATALNLQDGGQLVRVEVPRSALIRYGLPVNMDRAGERVKADVLVGNDGLARAIRFVR